MEKLVFNFLKVFAYTMMAIVWTVIFCSLMVVLTGNANAEECDKTIPWDVQQLGICTKKEYKALQKELRQPMTYHEAELHCSEGGVLHGEYLTQCIADAQKNGTGGHVKVYTKTRTQCVAGYSTIFCASY